MFVYYLLVKSANGSWVFNKVNFIRSGVGGKQENCKIIIEQFIWLVYIAYTLEEFVMITLSLIHQISVSEDEFGPGTSSRSRSQTNQPSIDGWISMATKRAKAYSSTSSTTIQRTVSR